MGPTPSKTRRSLASARGACYGNGSHAGPARAAAIPPLMGIVNRQGHGPTRAFASLYRGQIALLNEVFKPGDNEQTVYPPATAADFVRHHFLPAPELHRRLAREIWTLIREIGRHDHIVNGKRLYDHQLAHLIWVAASLADGKQSPSSFFIEGAPGTGKTLTLGMLMQACIRLQRRGLLGGKIAYCTAKPYHLSDKVRCSGMGRRRVLRAPPYTASEKDIRRRRLALRKIDAKFMDAFFPRKAWAALFAQRPATGEQARQLVDDYLAQHDLRPSPADAAMLDSVVQILASLATTVRGPDGSTELLALQSPPGDDLQIEAHTGDAAFAIPPRYPVFARENIGISTATRGEARVVLAPALVFTSARQVEKSQDELHRHVRVIFCDEAQRREPLAFQEPVYYAGAGQLPLVFAAGSRWYCKRWERRSPSHSFLESIRSSILPDLGVRLFPSATAVHYPAETEQALDQLLKRFFRDVKCFEEFGLRQPYNVNTLFVVHGRLVDHVVMRLRQKYAEQQPGQKPGNSKTPCRYAASFEAAEVRPFHGNEEDREVLQLWFDSERDGPNVLVSSPTIVKESLDLRTIRHLVVGTRVSADALYHLIGRLAHSRAMRNKNDRVLLSMQQYADSNLRATPFVALNHGQEFSDAGFTWINGHVLISDRAFRRDNRRLQSNDHVDQVRVPATGRRKRGQPLPVKLSAGTSLLPGRSGNLIGAIADRLGCPPVSPLAGVPMVEEEYDPKRGPPSQVLARQWATECDGVAIFDTYPSIMLAVEEAHQAGGNPRHALEQKIAHLRERSPVWSSPH